MLRPASRPPQPTIRFREQHQHRCRALHQFQPPGHWRLARRLAGRLRGRQALHPADLRVGAATGSRHRVCGVHHASGVLAGRPVDRVLGGERSVAEARDSRKPCGDDDLRAYRGWSRAALGRRRHLLRRPGQGNQAGLRQGGKPDMVVPAGREEFYGPQLLADGDTLFFTVGTRGISSWDRARHRRPLAADESGRRSSKGRRRPLRGIRPPAVRRGGVLYAVALDLSSRAVVGEPVAVVEGVRRSAPATTGAVHFAVSERERSPLFRDRSRRRRSRSWRSSIGPARRASQRPARRLQRIRGSRRMAHG